MFGLIVGSEVVLGPSTVALQRGVPLEQLVSRQRLRPGSGYLTVKVLTDGPTRVLQVTDIKDSVRIRINIIFTSGSYSFYQKLVIKVQHLKFFLYMLKIFHHSNFALNIWYSLKRWKKVILILNSLLVSKAQIICILLFSEDGSSVRRQWLDKRFCK